MLKPGGAFLAKVFQSGADAELLAQLKRDFASVQHVKPAASRQDSSERYVLATGFRGEVKGGGLCPTPASQTCQGPDPIKQICEGCLAEARRAKADRCFASFGQAPPKKYRKQPHAK